MPFSTVSVVGHKNPTTSVEVEHHFQHFQMFDVKHFFEGEKRKKIWKIILIGEKNGKENEWNHPLIKTEFRTV